MLLALAGIGLGAGIWFVQGAFTGDVFFHLGRIRKLEALHSLSLHDVGEFRHGGLHPGYAFPLWHAWLALVARLAGVDPTSVAAHEASILVPLALVLVFEMGWAIFRSVGLALAVVFAQLAYKAFAPGHGGVYRFLWQPASLATQLLVPVAVGLFFYFVRKPSWTTAVMLAATSASLSLVHPTYALFIAIPLIAYVIARALLTCGSDVRTGSSLSRSSGCRWRSRSSGSSPSSRRPSRSRPSRRSSRRTCTTTAPTSSCTRSRATASLRRRIDRNGAVTIVALLLVPLALLARRRRWSALVLGGTVAVLAIELWPLVFPHFSNLVSLSQSRRLSGFVPFAVALAGGFAIISRFSRTLALVGALGCGIWLQVAYAGDFGLRAPKTEPSIVVWIALYGGDRRARRGRSSSRGGVTRIHRRPARARATASPLWPSSSSSCPSSSTASRQWTPAAKHDRNALTPGLIHFLQHDVAPRSVVFADLATSYRTEAFAPVYVVAVPPTHAANTRPNELAKRRRAVLRFFAHPSLEEPQAWGAQWLVLTRSGPVQAIEHLGLRPALRGPQVRRLPGSAGLVLLRTLKVLLVTRHFPPGGGGGVQRPLKFATHLPALGIETHVLAPDVSGPPDEELELPTQAWIHRVRYVGPRAAVRRRSS